MRKLKSMRPVMRRIALTKTQRRRSLAVWVVVLLVGCPLGYVGGSAFARLLGFRNGILPSPAPPEVSRIGDLSVLASHLELGEGWETPSHTFELPIRNTSTRDVVIIDFIKSCSCILTAPMSLTD